MKKVLLLICVLFLSSGLYSQGKFELSASAKFGYFFPPNKTHSPFFPDNTFSPDAGILFQYNLFNNTSVLLGVEGNFLSPAMTGLWGKQLDVKWHSLNIPLNVKQGIGSHFFITGGAILVRQLSGYWDDPGTPQHNQEIPEFNWQTGAGWNLGRLNLSLNYTRGFKTIGKRIKTSPNSFSGVDIRHREVFIKMEYALWKF